MGFAGLRTVTPFGVRIEPDGTVSLSPGLSAIAVTDSLGRRIATVYGLVLAGWMGPGLALGPEGITADFPVDDEAAFVRRVVHGLHGMFLAVTQGHLGRFLHPDFGGSIPIVWCGETGAIGASADQILDEDSYQKRFLRDRYQRMILSEGHGWITGTLTAHTGVHRLLPGHALDLERLVAHRVWPVAGELALDMGLEDAARTAGQAIRGHVEAAAREHHTAITMTAGFDSRILIAAARDVKDQIGFVTFGRLHEGLDQDMAAKMSEALGLHHHLLPIVDASPEDQDHWERLVGHCMREVNRRIHPTLAAVPYDLILTGMYGEIGRARLYRQDIATINDQAATVPFVLSRLTLPQDSDQIADVERWLDGLSWMPRSMVLDMAFNELKFGTWALGQSRAQKAVKFSMMPFAQAAVQSAFMRTPPEVKGTEALFHRMAELLWPEAMQFPVNRYGDSRDRLGKFAKLTRRESLVRFFRDRFAG